MGGGNAAREA